MQAVVFHAVGDIRLEDVAEPKIQQQSDAVVRARVMKGYEILRAPFDGTVTARYADPGALLPAATGSTSSAQPLLEVAQRALFVLPLVVILARIDVGRAVL